MRNRRVWRGLAVLFAANYLILFAQTVVSGWKWRQVMPMDYLFPEARYWLQGLIVLVPLVPTLLLKMRHGRKILAVLLAACVLHAMGYLAKAHVPNARRQRCVAACDWAVERIRADYNGPKADAEPFFSVLEYHPLSRPCVQAHTTRVPYLLGGRAASFVGCGLRDIPDYIVDEPHRINRDWWSVAEYEALAERRFGTHDFVIYRRVK